jgi:hypothetical protein
MIRKERTKGKKKERNVAQLTILHEVPRYISLHFIHSTMALQPFVKPWPLLQFRNLFCTSGRTPWKSYQSVARPVPTRRTTHTSIP